MRFLRPCIFASFLLQSLSPFLAAQPPEIGQWVAGPKGNRNDLVPDALTSAQLAMVGGSAALTNQAAVFLGCKGNDAGPPTLELRFLVQPTRGFVPGAVSKSASLAIDDDKRPVTLDIFPVQTATMIIVNPTPAEAKKMATIKLNQRANMALNFQMGGRNAFLLTTLNEPEEPVSTVLHACGVSVMAPISPSMSIATPAMKKYTFQGFYLGMPVQQARTIEKAIATTPIKPGPGGGVDFETAQFYFISVTADDKGFIRFYKVCGKPSKMKSGPRSGPLYEAAVKAFGPATGKSSSPGTVQWDKSGGVDVRYDWDADEGPNGCLYVTPTAH